MDISYEKIFKKIDLILLLGSLLIFSCGVGLLHGDGKEDVSPNQMYQLVIGFIETGDATEIAKQLVEYPNTIIPIATKIINDKTSISRDNKVLLIFELVGRVSDKKVQDALFNLLINNPDLQQGDPFLYLVALDSKMPQAIPAFLAWAKTYASSPKSKPDIVKIITSAGSNALHFAIYSNNKGVLEKLVANGVIVDAALATSLLLQAVKENQNSDFIPLLKKMGANINAEDPDKKGMTPLIQAVDNENTKMVQAIIDAGADVALIKDPAVGSALQHAVKLRDTSIDTLLRQKGARE